MKTLFIIPARGGSKGIPKKNIRLFGGKPLLIWSIEQAREITTDSNICLSTDSTEIRTIAEKAGLQVPFMRPAELATDQAGTYEVLLHAVEHYEEQGLKYDNLVLLQPTSPFRTAQHIREAMGLYTSGIDMVVSVTNSIANPYYNLFEEDADGFLQLSKPGHFTRRQDIPNVYEYNGAIYVINLESLKKRNLSGFRKKVKYVMEQEDSLELDTELDWDFAEFMLARKTR